MSDLSLGRPVGEFCCPRCEAVMTVVVQIPPLGSGPGLIGYECPKVCVRNECTLEAERHLLMRTNSH